MGRSTPCSALRARRSPSRGITTASKRLGPWGTSKFAKGLIRGGSGTPLTSPSNGSRGLLAGIRMGRTCPRRVTEGVPRLPSATRDRHTSRRARQRDRASGRPRSTCGRLRRRRRSSSESSDSGLMSKSKWRCASRALAGAPGVRSGRIGGVRKLSGGNELFRGELGMPSDSSEMSSSCTTRGSSAGDKLPSVSVSPPSSTVAGPPSFSSASTSRLPRSEPKGPAQLSCESKDSTELSKSSTSSASNTRGRRRGIATELGRALGT
mmetsp:Transcript_16228/g.61842  ORF Transcript_16228/g.61842 Transcript_16228/m.61842 type:complete len:265 (+) Transcript_16228:1786-2580(+)|eukprot:scaffold228_cov312-Pinguiococcus_pyrenoidosus.AAC.29